MVSSSIAQIYTTDAYFCVHLFCLAFVLRPVQRKIEGVEGVPSFVMCRERRKCHEKFCYTNIFVETSYLNSL